MVVSQQLVRRSNLPFQVSRLIQYVASILKELRISGITSVSYKIITLKNQKWQNKISSRRVIKISVFKNIEKEKDRILGEDYLYDNIFFHKVVLQITNFVTVY